MTALSASPRCRSTVRRLACPVATSCRRSPFGRGDEHALAVRADRGGEDRLFGIVCGQVHEVRRCDRRARSRAGRQARRCRCPTPGRRRSSMSGETSKTLPVWRTPLSSADAKCVGATVISRRPSALNPMRWSHISPSSRSDVPRGGLADVSQSQGSAPESKTRAATRRPSGLRTTACEIRCGRSGQARDRRGSPVCASQSRTVFVGTGG